MIYYSIPFSIEKNIGKYYNDFMELLPSDDDFACFVDGDTIFTTPNYGNQIEEATKKYPKVGCFTAYTNRVNCEWQIYPGVDKDNNDMYYHRQIGKQAQERFWSKCIDVTDMPRDKVLSGFLMLLKKSVWKKIGGFKDGVLGVDNDLHWKIQDHKESIHLMQGVYLYHWYRWPNYKDKSHLI